MRALTLAVLSWSALSLLGCATARVTSWDERSGRVVVEAKVYYASEAPRPIEVSSSRQQAVDRCGGDVELVSEGFASRSGLVAEGYFGTRRGVSVQYRWIYVCAGQQPADEPELPFTAPQPPASSTTRRVTQTL
jgi:hypothetical protein